MSFIAGASSPAFDTLDTLWLALLELCETRRAAQGLLGPCTCSCAAPSRSLCLRRRLHAWVNTAAVAQPPPAARSARIPQRRRQHGQGEFGQVGKWSELCNMRRSAMCATCCANHLRVQPQHARAHPAPPRILVDLASTMSSGVASLQLLQRVWCSGLLRPAAAGCAVLGQVAPSASALGRAAEFGTSALLQQAAQPAAGPTRDVGVVPPGHLNSDLSPTACHIGLGRRRDLTLRQDLALHVDGSKQPLEQVFKVRGACGASQSREILSLRCSTREREATRRALRAAKSSSWASLAARSARRSTSRATSRW